MLATCPNKDRCGSCGWSHIPYEKQLAQKLSDINGSFKLKELDLICEEIVPSPRVSHYRNRMDFVIDFEGRVGLREKGKWWKVIDGHPCFIADERIEALFHKVRSWVKEAGLSFYDRKSFKGLLRYAVIRSTSTGQALLNLITSTPSDLEKVAAETAIADLASVVSPCTVVWSTNSTTTDVSTGDQTQIISGSGFLEEQILSSKYRISPQAFFQTNSFCAPILLDLVCKYVGDVGDKTLLDLYCGSGFFSIALGRLAKRTVGVELVKEAIIDARENAKLNGVNVEYFDEKTESFNWGDLGADVVIVDPPRSGMHDDALKSIIKIKPPKIVYVSCNYKNFAREMVLLKEIYEVANIKAVDMFPQTPHVELVAELLRK